MAQNKSCYSKWEGWEQGKEGLGQSPCSIVPGILAQLPWVALSPLSVKLSMGWKVWASPISRGLHCNLALLPPVSFSGFSGPPCRDSNPFAPCQILAAFWNLGTSLYGPVTLAFSIWQKGYQVAAAKVCCQLTHYLLSSYHSWIGL